MQANAFLKGYGGKAEGIVVPQVLLGGERQASYIVERADALGVKLLPTVPAGLPGFVLPKLSLAQGRLSELLMLSLTIALVVMAQTLLASSNYAVRYDDPLDSRRELLAYGAAELASAALGCCPVNGSVSRSGIADQFGCRSQLMSLTAAGCMVLVLLFGTPYLALLPVPVLTGIVIAALAGILEIGMAKKLWKSNKQELIIFLTAFLGVLILGTINGVVIGVILSFMAVVVRAVVPPRTFLGVIPGHEDFFDLRRNRSARPIEHTVIYRFSGNVFFANVGTFQKDIEDAVGPDTKQVIVDGRGVGNIDITAAERITALEKNLRKRGVRLYLTEHVGAVNDQLRRYGAEELIESGAVRRTVALALRDAGLQPPYPLEGGGESRSLRDERESFAEFEWLYGAESESRFEKFAAQVASALTGGCSLEEAERRSGWGRVGIFDEAELLELVELDLEAMADSGTVASEKVEQLEQSLEAMLPGMEGELEQLPPKTREFVKNHRSQLQQRLRQRSPSQFARLEERRRRRRRQ